MVIVVPGDPIGHLDLFVRLILNLHKFSPLRVLNLCVYEPEEVVSRSIVLE